MPESAEDDVYDGGALKVAIMVVSMLAVCTLVVIYSVSIFQKNFKIKMDKNMLPYQLCFFVFLQHEICVTSFFYDIIECVTSLNCTVQVL